MLKTSTGKLYTLLSACKPDNEKIQKRLAITEIMEMPEYRALQVYQGSASVMDDYYSPEKLQELSFDKIQEVKRIVSFLEDCIRRLYGVICYGDIRILDLRTQIDFYNADSLYYIYESIYNIPQTGINITNITEYDVWSVFSSDTVMNTDNLLNKYNSNDMETLEIRIINDLKNKKYCISAAEIAEKRKAYRDIFRKQETVRLRLQIVENKIFIKKLFWSLLSVAFVSIQFKDIGITFGSFGKILTLSIYFLALILYWFLG